MSVNTMVVEAPCEAGTEVEVEEYALEGPVAAIWKPLFEGAMAPRNQEMLRRLKRLAERRLAGRSERGLTVSA